MMTETDYRALDLAIATYAFGEDVEILDQKHGWRIDLRAKSNELNDAIMTDYGVAGYKLKRFSRDAAAMMQLIEELRGDAYWVIMTNRKGLWKITIVDAADEEIVSAQDYSLPVAVCSAALVVYKR